jgi:hypothetical protein
MKNSSRLNASPTLVKTLCRADAMAFLTELANLKDERPALERLENRYPWLKSPDVNSMAKALAIRNEDCELDDLDRLRREYWLIPLRDVLRAIWRETDERTREWAIFSLVEDFFEGPPDGSPVWGKLVRPGGVGPDYLPRKPQPGPGEQSVRQLLHTDLSRVCGNPECAAPFFFAQRRNQKYCTPECSKPSQQEFKRKWWAENRGKTQKRN